MIDKSRIQIDWIEHIAKQNRGIDKILVEKVIRALLLLEGLAFFGLDFVFKGGTSLMLHLASSKRLSIDIDIILHDAMEDLGVILQKVADYQGFNRVELQRRSSYSKIEKAHYKFFYTPFHNTTKNEAYILLDILFENVAYAKILQLPIVSSFVPLLEEPVMVNVPSLEDLLGDKLTAFAPNTTGIPYFKGEDGMGMEIIKQLYDVGNLFDVCVDINIVKRTFFQFAKTELSYRLKDGLTEKDVLDDIFQTSLCIASRGSLGNGNFAELLFGIKRVAGFIFSEAYHIEKAIVSASKSAYLAALILSDSEKIEKFEGFSQIENWSIIDIRFNKMNKLKKTNPEAFFYWYKAVALYFSENHE